MEKEYGKLTEGQFKRLVRALPEIQKESKRAEEVMRAASKEKLREILGDGISWSAIYEVSLIEGTAHLVLALGYADRLMANAGLADCRRRCFETWNQTKKCPGMGVRGAVYKR